MGIIKKGYTFSERNEDWASRKATAIRLNKLIDEAEFDGSTNSNGYAPDDGITPNDPTSLSYTSGVESIVLSWNWEQNTLPLKTRIFESTTATLPATPSFFVGQDQRSFFRQNLVAGSVRYYWVQVEARNGRVSNIIGPLAAAVATWPITDTITVNLGKKITRLATEPASPNEGDIWINTSENNVLYRRESGVWVRYSDTRVDSFADEYVLMVTSSAAGPSQRITGFRTTNDDGGKAILSASRSNNVVTVVTTTPHGYTTNNLVSLVALGFTTINLNPNRSYFVTVATPGSSTFTCLLPEGSGSETYSVAGAYSVKGTEFVIQADKFSVIDSSGFAQEAPFEVIGGVVKIKNAIINTVSADKLTSGIINAGNITLSDGLVPGSAWIASSDYSQGVSGWKIGATNIGGLPVPSHAEFNSITVRNGVLAAPSITDATLTNVLTIDSTLGIRRSVNNAVLTITGASSNGSNNGAQIDLVGNTFAGAGGPGHLVLQSGNVSTAEVRIQTGVSPALNTGVERVAVEYNGLVNIRRNQSNGGGYSDNAGNVLVGANIGVGTSVPINSNTSQGNISLSGVIKAVSGGSEAAPAFTFSDPSTGMFYDGGGKIAFSGGGIARLFVSPAHVTVNDVLKIMPYTDGIIEVGCISYQNSNLRMSSGLDVEGTISATEPGTAALPAFALSGTGTGMFYSGLNTAGISGGGAARLFVSDQGVTVNDVLTIATRTSAYAIPDGSIWFDGTSLNLSEPLICQGDMEAVSIQATSNGSAASPAFTFPDSDTGMFYESLNKVAISAGGIARLFVSNERVTVNDVLKIMPYTSGFVEDGCIFYNASGFNFQNSLVSPGSVQGSKFRAVSDGTAALPAYTFNDVDTGMFYDGANKVAISGGGISRLFVSNERVSVEGVFKLIDYTGGGTPPFVENGCIWYDGTNFKVRTGGVNRTITIT